jgi:hypothetical protein
VRQGNRLQLTSRGRYAAQIATSYGVTVSYLPLFDVLPTLLFGNAKIPRVDEAGGELLVNRGMNVWGSEWRGGSPGSGCVGPGFPHST